MGFFDRFKSKPPSYLGITADEVGNDFDWVVKRMYTKLWETEAVISDMGAMTMCRSPVLVIRDGVVVQPAAVVPTPMLSRFWKEPGCEFFDDPLLAKLVAGYAQALASNDELAKAALSDTENIWVHADAPVAQWPDQDKRVRLASLVLADVVRKLAADFTPADIKASYGFSEDIEAARARVEAMQAEEQPWFMAALKPPD